ncbi:MAG: hypothetical protein MJ231_03430 [bacterium]|nr:hypothetical protein [bacterium]
MPALQTVALVAPTVTAQAIFSSRRAKKGAENIDDYPIFGLMNLDLALGQFLKGIRATRAAAIAINSGAAGKIQKASDASKNAAKTIKKLGPIGEIVDFTAYHINPIIWAAATVKGLGSKDEDKPTALVRELLPVGTMRLCEEGCNRLIGMPITSKDAITGIQENISRKGAYLELFNKEQQKAITDYIETTNLFNKLPVKNVVGATKGVIFVLASIGGYKLGTIIADKLLGKKPTATVPATT